MDFIKDPEDKVVALVIPRDQKRSNVQFITEHDQNPQIALMLRPEGEYIQAHLHLPLERTVVGTPEVLIIEKGKMRVDFFDAQEHRFHSCEVGTGDIVVLFSGGHGFKVLEETKMVEIKQGPFVEGLDKRKFSGPWES